MGDAPSPNAYPGVSFLLAPHKLARFAPCAVVLCAFIATFAATAGTCVSTSADKTQIAETMRTMYAAASAENLAKFHTIATPDFYAFDGGKRYDGDALMNMVKGFTRRATHLCGQSPTRTLIRAKAGAPQRITWLESAALEKQKGTWRIRFFHSTRVP